MIREINIVTAACKLASEALKKDYERYYKNKPKKEIENLIYIKNSDDATRISPLSRYTPKAQIIFDDHYDYYYDLLLKCKT